MPLLTGRPPPVLTYAGALLLTAGMLALSTCVPSGAPVHTWFLFGAAAAAAAGALAGGTGVVVSAAATAISAGIFAVPPATGPLPDATLLAAFGVFVAAAVFITYLSHVRTDGDSAAACVEAAARAVEGEARRRQMLVSLAERGMTGGRPDALCRHAAAAMSEALGVRCAIVLELQPDGGALTVTAEAGWDPPVEGLTLDASVDSHLGFALFGREPAIVHDAETERRFAVPPELRARGARSGIAARIGADRSIGLVAVYDSAPRAFDPAEVQFVRGVALTLAAAFERRRLEDERAELVARDEVLREEARLAAHRATFLAQTVTVLDAALEPETTLVSLARLAVPTMADCAVVDLVEEDRVRRIDVVEIDPSRRQEAEALRRLAPDLRTEGPFPRAIRTGQPVLLPDLTRVAAPSPVDAGHLHLLRRLGCQSLLLIPLVARGQTLGLLTLGSRVACRYEGADLSLAQELAGRAAIALDNGRLHREAQAASRAKDEFLALVSHELRTPLNAVMGWSAILRVHRLDEERAGHALDAIQRNVRAQATLLEQLLDVSRVVAGKLELRLSSVLLGEIVGAAVDAVRPAAEERGVDIVPRLDPALPPMTADPDRLQQVVVNLLSNAVKFTPQGGRVEVETRRATDAAAEILVRDYGAGISRDFLPYVFDRFRQSAPHSGRTTEGLGLGLWIAREIVERHGGTVEADSAGEGEGATFRVRLPLRSRTDPTVEQSGPPGDPRSELR